MDDSRVPPHDREAERAVISAAILNQEACDELLSQLRPDGSEFYADEHRRVWAAIADVRGAGELVELVAVASALSARGHLQRIGGPAALAEMVDATPAITNAALHARRVRDLHRLRSTGYLFRRLGAEAFGDVADVGEWLQRAESAVYDAAAVAESEAAGVWYRDDMREGLASVREARDAGPQVRGVTTGFRCLADHVGGFMAGDLWYVAGRPGQGKTALACAMTEASAQDGWAWLNLALEMSRAKLRERALSRASRIPARALRSGQLTAAQWEDLAAAADRLSRLPIQTDDASTLTPALLRAKVRRWLSDLRRTYPDARPAGVIIDHIQLTDPDQRGQNRNAELTTISRACKQVAKEFGITVLALSQLSRPPKDRKPGRPQLTDLRESGALEQDADVVLFVHRPSEYSGEPVRWPDEAELVVAKGRDVGSGLHRVLYDGPTTRFYEDDRTSDQDPREPPLGRSWSPRDGSPRPAPRSYHEPPERDDPDEPDEYGIPRSL